MSEENEAIIEKEAVKFISENIIPEPQFIASVSSELGIKDFQTQTVLELIGEGSTTPFIARYRKEAT